MDPELAAYDYHIRAYRAEAVKHTDLSNYFAELAVRDQAEVARYTAMRDAYLGRMGVDNVVPLKTAVDS